MRKITISSIMILSLMVISVGLWLKNAAPQTNDEIVEQFFPQRLLDESNKDFNEGGPLPFNASAFVATDLNGNGDKFIIAAYSNGFSGSIRVLKKANSTFSIVDEPNIPKLSGVFPKVRLLNLDNDNRQEIIVSFSSARGPGADWVFKWNGTNLDLISPTTVDDQGEIDTILSDASFFDIDGDGKIEIFNPTDSGPTASDETEPIGVVGKSDVFILKDGDYGFFKSIVLGNLKVTEANIEDDEFEIKGSFTLAAASNGIDPLTEDVTLTVGTFSTTIPVGSFELDDGTFEFENAVDAEIRPLGDDTFGFEFEGEDVNLEGTIKPVDVALTIGDDIGIASEVAEIDLDDDEEEDGDDNDEEDEDDD